LSYALAIHDKCSAITFEVSELQAYKREYPDPFLIAIYGEERAYIAVWDEPKFEFRKTTS
jgi:hypothetical protein